MLLDGFFETLNEFTEIIKKKFRIFYQNSSLYEKKISKTFDNETLGHDAFLCFSTRNILSFYDVAI